MKSYYFLLVFISFFCFGCTKNNQPSVLLLFVEDLSSNDVPCNSLVQNETSKGFNVICTESVRFTHAYTPSPLSVASVSTVLTGQYPYQHKANHNGTYLSPETLTIPELYLSKGYRTAFFSGGSPILRKTGVNQGFETFDDQIHPTSKKLIRSFKETIESTKTWLKESNKPFFAAIYIPDLIFTNTITSNESGEVRNFSYESQFEEFDLQLSNLVNHLKANNQWNNTYIFLIGLSGPTGSLRESEINPLNLHSENTQTALLIKPAGKARDLGLSWKFDKNISLADVGQTLMDIIQERKNTQELFKTESLLAIIQNKKNVNIDNSREILVESAWSKWRENQPVRYSIINGNSFLIYDSPPKAYNTLIDRFEVSPTSISSIPSATLVSSLDKLSKISATPWPSRPSDFTAQFKIPFYKWMRSDQLSTLETDLQKLYQETKNPLAANWYAFALEQNKKWTKLLQLGFETKNSLWITASNQLLNKTNPSDLLPDHCFELLNEKKIDAQKIKTCSDREFIDFLSWVHADELRLNSEKQKNNFIRNYWHNRISRAVYKANIATSWILDTNSLHYLKPSRTDLALNLDRYKQKRFDLAIELQKLDDQFEPINLED